MAAMLSCQRADNSLNIPPPSCRSGFDFSLLFEELILGILPLGIVLALVPFQLRHLFGRPRKVEASWLAWAKTVSWIVLVITHLVLTVLWSLPSAWRTEASIAANAVMTVGIFLLCLFSYAEHHLSVRPSFLLNVYLGTTLLFSIAKARTLWLRHPEGINRDIAIITSLNVGITLLLLIMEATEKRRFLRKEYKGYPPEALAGIYNRLFFCWLNPLFYLGFTNPLLGVDDLFTLDKQLESKRLHRVVENLWNKEDRKSPNALLSTCFKAFKWQISAGIPPRVMLAALNICQPLLLERSLSFTESAVNKDTDNIGYGLIGAYILVYIGLAVTMGQYQHMTYRSITMVRGGVVSMIYEKACTLSTKDADPASSVTLMSADVERIVQGWQTMHDIWGNALEIALAIYLLERQLGVSCVVPVAVAIAMTFVMAGQAKWLEAIERRISSTSSMLSSMKGIKMLGLQSALMTCVHNLRLDELSISRYFRKLLVWNMALAWITRIFAPIFAFGAFVGISHDRGNDAALTISVAYTSLSLFSLLSDPLLSLVMALMTFVGSVGSFQRIQEFLDQERHIDSRAKSTELPYNIPEEKGQLALVDDAETNTTESGSSSSLNKPHSPLFQDALTVQNGAFGWDTTKEPLLKNLTIAIPQGGVTILIGPSGCGKTTLLKAILGEVPCLSGNIRLSSESIAYCEQTPWHMNGTIQDCIVAMSTYDSQWYRSVINACALVEDFKQLPRGDQTVIGSKGIALSGGQSQRIALARAVYARKEVIILDDVFSSLDATTEDHIFHHLIGSHGLLRSLDSTIIFASSSVKRAPYADHIIVLDNKGYVIEQGSFKALDCSGGYVSSFSLGFPEWGYKADMFPASGVEIKTIEKTAETDTESETATRPKGGDVSIYLYYVQSIGWFPTIVFLVAIASFVFCISFPSIWVQWWADSDQAEPGKRTGYYLGIYAMLGVLGMLGLMIGTWEMVINMVPKSGEVFHRKLLRTVLSAPMLFFSKTDSGAILNRFSQDLQLIDMELPVAAINTFATFALCIAQMLLMAVASRYVAIAFPIVLIIVYLIQKMYLRTSRQLRYLDLEAKAPLFSHFTDCLSGLVTLRAFGWQHALQEKNYRLLDYSQRPFYLLYAIQRWLTLSLDMVVAGIAVLLIILVVILRGSISAGWVGVALLNVIQFSQSIKLLITFWTNLETHIGSIQRVRSFSETVPSEDLPSENDDMPPEWPSQGDIEFKSVSAEYRASEPVLNGVSLSIRAGEKVGICGRTGSGKSSLIMSIFRMIDISSGQIVIDGLDITKLPRQEIRSRINGVSQSPLLIKGSVRTNADPMGSSSDEAINSALESVGLYSQVQEKGGLAIDMDELFLSHGQQQLFCLARAILRPGNILVLDEATSSVDTRTDEVMQRIIREKFSTHTILTVAHKLDTILDYDKVVVLEAGRLVECGTPHDLLASDKSYFSKLYASLTTEEQEGETEVSSSEI
ncbi:P-loop containing nucleoside triphosphate hydrolase protein [Aspergillus heteromorphus CBS 117.55]|uniref:P-loop containing nucleoside triphosphate hydrolase protein n=1 Tax=Aspergillus heteromorphus CBS 117.55 TaxID=1448321 RepID=A0A317W5S0_9EURO|nr:P-loop containing nucleoside triphosphate hydrolase protein [Aspergillus heteromorphus CBS 117.55]PWY81946.1 P-loop containing nucleoside triphosphate hydrolase protein [Aspergillus heteromorphus CBS 117.55]